eukprot:jgi/Ulvmu1/2377/UM130_0010.1
MQNLIGQLSYRTEHCAHSFDVPSCGGPVLPGRPSSRALVMHRVEKYAGRQCALTTYKLNCHTPPAPGQRFCDAQRCHRYRLHCNPYDPDSKRGLIEVMSTAAVGPWHELKKVKGSTCDSYRRSRTGLKVGTKVLGDYKTKVEIREFSRQCTDNSGCLMEERVTAAVGDNTEAAEQCFKELRMSSQTLRMMGVWSARMFLALRVHCINLATWRGRYKTTLDTDGPISRRWRPGKTLGKYCLDW